MAGYTTVRHHALANVTGYIYTDDYGNMFAGVKEDSAQNINWQPAADPEDAKRIVKEILIDCASQVLVPAPPPPPYQGQYSGYQSGYPGQAPPQQPYQLTPSDQKKAQKKARNQAIRTAVWESMKDARARASLEKACLKYACPECSSGQGVKCVSIHGRNTLPAPHVSRIEQYQRQNNW